MKRNKNKPVKVKNSTTRNYTCSLKDNKLYNKKVCILRL